MEFEKMISDAVNKKLNDGTVEALVNKKLEEAIEKNLGECLGWNGGAYKLLKSKLDEVMVPCIERQDFNKYLTKLDSCLTEIVNKTNLKDNREILNNFAGLMKEPESDTVKSSEISEKYCDHVAKNVNMIWKQTVKMESLIIHQKRLSWRWSMWIRPGAILVITIAI